MDGERSRCEECSWGHLGGAALCGVWLGWGVGLVSEVHIYRV